MKRLTRLLLLVLAVVDPETGRLLSEMRQERREERSSGMADYIPLVIFMVIMIALFGMYVWLIANTGRNS